MTKQPIHCKYCNEPLQYTFADLGIQPVCESYLTDEQLNKMEPFYPLHVYFCSNCFLVQLEESITPQQIFNNYSYFSSHSKGWLKHVENYVEMIIKKLNLNEKSQVIEIGSNDGYLLQFFVQKNIPALGIEPAMNVANEAIQKGIPTIIKFFELETAEELLNQNKYADLLVVNNVLAQVPDINGFIRAMKKILKPSGVITAEFHHIMKLIDNSQFDTISHERFFHFSFGTLERIFASHGLTVFDVEEIPTHGGSLRVYVRHSDNNSLPVSSKVNEVKNKEKIDGLFSVPKYLSFAEKVKVTRWNVLSLLLELKRNKKSIIGYGAHAEAHTFLNYCGLRLDFLDYTADRNPFKHGKYLAGVRIPIFAPDRIKETKPDYIFILPWAIKSEIMNQLSYIGEWGGKFITAIPEIIIYDSNGRPLNDIISNKGGN